jgi:hypothetical protein
MTILFKTFQITPTPLHRAPGQPPRIGLRTPEDVYKAAAEFAGTVGDRLVSISGSPFGQDVVVWYRAEDWEYTSR